MAGRQRRGVAAAEVAVALIAISLTAIVVFIPTEEERTGRIAATLRCLDPGCEGMTVEQAVMSERSFDPRNPQARRVWHAIWNGQDEEDVSADAVGDGLVEKYGERILLDAPSPGGE